ncbi:PDZ and LIM domain protein 1-like isoform X3 [Mizuhopecten yessoensis]|uniref:PDZ and LIM domain protein 1-like isoform X2 n=1 Tax=Mizuhopecten yessoensis TaxID=6573 RepID=UPI000B45BC7D|nr:PDZ and LIM domain protein 1-like isoform X2 [Mizuhopecten yessoensis]XP_021362431.1 PDZ and LIM domain protein 1-like isoform X3 [Mizuhopecten yessoensis]
MAQPEMMTIRLVRPDTGVSWGFRLQGGNDFSTPLSLQSVTPGSVAERSGLRAGDGVLYINDVNTDTLTHDDAKCHIIRSGNDIYVTVQRGAVSVWAPKVTPMSQLRPQELRTIKTATGDEVQAVQKTSLARSHQPDPLHIGSSYNRTPRSFGQGPQSPKKPIPNVVHSQFNSPIGLYSADNLANTYKMQTAGIQKEMENLDVDDEPVGTRMSGTYHRLDSQDESNPSGFKSVRAPERQPAAQQQQQQQNMHCGECGNMVMGVFVKVQGVPYHPGCFKCAKCGVNLKQRGYFVIEDRLYCETHAKQVAQPPDPNMKAVPVYR